MKKFVSLLLVAVVVALGVSATSLQTDTAELQPPVGAPVVGELQPPIGSPIVAELQPPIGAPYKG